MATTTLTTVNWFTKLSGLLKKASSQVNDRGHLLQAPIGELQRFMSQGWTLLTIAAGATATNLNLHHGVAHYTVTSTGGGNLGWLEAPAIANAAAGTAHVLCVTVVGTNIPVKVGATTIGTISAKGVYVLYCTGSAYTLTKVADLA